MGLEARLQGSSASWKLDSQLLIFRKASNNKITTKSCKIATTEHRSKCGVPVMEPGDTQEAAWGHSGGSRGTLRKQTRLLISGEPGLPWKPFRFKSIFLITLWMGQDSVIGTASNVAMHGLIHVYPDFTTVNHGSRRIRTVVYYQLSRTLESIPPYPECCRTTLSTMLPKIKASNILNFIAILIHQCMVHTFKISQHISSSVSYPFIRWKEGREGRKRARTRKRDRERAAKLWLCRWLQDPLLLLCHQQATLQGWGALLFVQRRHICERKLVIIVEAPASSNHWNVFLSEISTYSSNCAVLLDLQLITAHFKLY